MALWKPCSKAKLRTAPGHFTYPSVLPALFPTAAVKNHRKLTGLKTVGQKSKCVYRNVFLLEDPDKNVSYFSLSEAT